jgi:hypothetical protein
MSLTSSYNFDKQKPYLREKQVDHARYVGLLSDGDFSPKYHDIGYDPDMGPIYLPAIWTYKPGSHFLNGYRANGFNDLGHLTFSEETVGSPLTSFYMDAVQSTKMHEYAIIAEGELEFVPFHLGELVWSRFYSNVSNLSTMSSHYNDAITGSKVVSYSVDVSYQYEIRYVGSYPAPQMWAKYDVHILFSISFETSVGHNPPFDVNILDSNCVKIVDLSTTTLNSSSIFNGQVNQPWSLVRQGNPVIYTDTVQLADEFSLNFSNFRRSHSGPSFYIHSNLARLVEDHMKDIRPSSFLAASDALQKYIGVLKSNSLENLVQLKGVLDLLPDVAGLAELAAKATHGDPSVIPELVDYITNAILKYRFAQRPTAVDVAEFMSTNVEAKLTSLLQSKEATITGKFSYDFPVSENFFGPGRLLLETRSKIRVRLDMSTLLVSYLTANSVGMLPTLSRVWALLPFSFVVDWFVNMSKRLEQVDNQLLWLAMCTEWCLWSYKVVYYPTESELDEFNLTSYDPDEPFGISVYKREFSRYTPRLCDSHFDFLRVVHGANPVTVGSLVWQQL